MYLRKSRLRFIVFIVCLCLIFYKLKNLFQTHNDRSSILIENIFWKELQDRSRPLTDRQRLEHIEFVLKSSSISYSLNWTKIFYDFYEQKMTKLNDKRMKIIYKDKQENLSQTFFQIFEETPVFQRPKFCSSTRIFHSQCPFTNCQWTCQKSSLNLANYRQASIFHHVDINLTELDEKLKIRSKNDIWILWIDEANRQLEHLNKYFFNWTISFRQDSEISMGTYGLLIPHTKNNISSSINQSDFLYLLTNQNILITNFQLENRILTNFRYRSKHALWFVSNCQPKSRLNYYRQLKNYFPIHAYGSCVNKDSNICDKNTQCEYDQLQFAFFYLAFESQTCQDYITEKFWRALHYGMIPIVSGPNKQSYLNLGIPSSAFIHIDDFANAKELGKYLHELVNNYFLYRLYFQWLNQYDIVYKTADLESIRMCELCMRLNLQETNEYRFYENIHQWHRIEC